MESEILEKYVSKSSCLCLFFKDFAISYLFIFFFFKFKKNFEEATLFSK